MADSPEYYPDPPADALRWDRIVSWRPRLAVDAGGHRAGLERGADGVFNAPYVLLSETLAAFVVALYDEQVVVGFDWPGWMEERGRGLVAGRGLLTEASLEDCRRLLAALVRHDRFNEGALLHAFKDGLIDDILDRAETLIPR